MATTSSNTGHKINGSDCPILRLPNEILSNILRRVYELDCADFCHPSDRPRRAAELSSTCRQIRNILVPEIYSVFHIYHAPEVAIQQNERLRKSMSRVREILKDNPGLGLHCKTLRITLDEPTYFRYWEDYTATSMELDPAWPDIPKSISDVRGWLRNTRHVVIDGIDESEIHCFHEDVTEAIHHVLMSFPGLTTLSLKGDGIYMYDVLNGMRDVSKCHNLSSFDMGEVDPLGGDELGWDDELRDLSGTASMKKLDLTLFGQSPEALEVLVRWPKELHSLSVRHSQSGYRDGRDWTYVTLQPIFETQMANLRELNIYDLHQDQDTVLDLTGFTMLERLSLPAEMTGLNTRDMPRIVAPNLRFFRWQLQSLSFDDDRRAKWLRAMVVFAARQQQKLRTIFIASDRGVGLPSTYPWDVLDDIDRGSKKFGIRIRYNEPSVSRETFEERARKFRPLFERMRADRDRLAQR